VTSTNRLDYLDGIRALAVLAVLAVHWVAEYLPFGGGGYLGVDVFFVLSGYVITSVIWRSRATGPTWSLMRTFLWKRVRRLYPALIALAIVSPIGVALAPGVDASFSESSRSAGLALAQLTWLAEALGHTTEPFRQAWSLAIEWYFYLLWPVVVFAAKSRGVSAAVLARRGAIAAGVLYVAALPLSGPLFYVTPPARFAEILAGSVLALALIAHPEQRSLGKAGERWAVVAVLAVSAYVVLANWHYTEPPVRWLGVPLATIVTVYLIWHGVTAGQGVVHRFLSSAPLALVGRASYSLYLFHWLPMFLLDKDAIALPLPVLAVLAVAMAAGFTALSYCFLERPFMGSHPEALRTSATGTAQAR